MKIQCNACGEEMKIQCVACSAAEARAHASSHHKHKLATVVQHRQWRSPSRGLNWAPDLEEDEEVLSQEDEEVEMSVAKDANDVVA